eukprot:TRINITY_DN26634_c0_g1_i1.p1 TRINITY_DN26634_c0_g1~~TRINITY_DN26634_c0_g1_i1.p1  ORF type:complete len:2686 (+),score=507.28 TRINITY_DN26634_c0_g1_i1:210-8060(+)
MAYACRQWNTILANEGIVTHTRGMVRDATGARDYFEKFAQEAKVAGYQAGRDFWATYTLAIYRGFAWNFEDLVPERLEELIMELIVSVGIVVMKSYCIGSFFKYYQKREEEMQEFDELMQGVNQYMDLCDLPHSIRRATKQHFMFQQEKRQELQIAKVLASLPVEAQNKLKEFEFLPIILDRNQHIFGGPVSPEFLSQMSDLLQRRYLQPGEVIFLEGDYPRELYFLEHGSVSLSKLVAGKGKMSEHIMQTLRADRKEDSTVIGEASFILDQSHWHSARVRPGMEAIVLVLTRDSFEKVLMVEYPEQLDLVVRNIADSNALGAQGEGDFELMHADVNKLLQKREEDLHAQCLFAAGAGDAKLLKQMLDKRLDVNTSDYDKRSAMHLAASECHLDTLNVLIEARADVSVRDRWGSTPLQDALTNGFMGGAKLLYSHGAELGLEDPSGVLCNYASEGNTTKMQELLDFGVDMNAGDYDKRTAIHLSASEGKLPVVAYLACCKADVNVRDRWNSTPLEDAIRNGFHVVARFLKTHGGKINSDFAANMLCDAASSGSLAQLHMLFESGLDVDEGDYDRRTAVHLAAAEGQLLALDYLLNVAHASPSPRDRWEATPLQDALSGGHDLCSQLLLAVGAELGPNAPKEQFERAAQLRESWFKGEGNYSKEIQAMRHKISVRKKLVAQGSARPDIFDLEGAIKFTRKLVSSQIQTLPGMCRDIHSLSSLLRRLEFEGVGPMLSMLRLIDDSIELSTNSKAMARAAQDLKRSKKGKKGRAKDAQGGIFTKVHFGTLNFGPTLEEVMEVCTERLLRRVGSLQMARMRSGNGNGNGSMSSKSNGFGNVEKADDLHRGMSYREDPNTAYRLSDVVVEALYSALGWDDGEDDFQTGQRGNAGLLGLKGLDNDGSAQRKQIADRLEELAGELLPSQYMVMVLQRVIYCEMGRGDPILVPPLDSEASAKTPGGQVLRKWLHKRSYGVLGEDELGTGLPPASTLSPAPWYAAFAPLFPDLQSDGECRLPQHENSVGNGVDNGVSEKHRRLVAAELSMLAVVALVVDGWEKVLNEDQKKKKNDKRDDPMENKDNSNARLPPEAFLELGRVLQTASAYCSHTVNSNAAAGKKHQRNDMIEEALAEEDASNQKNCVDIASLIGTNSQMDADRLAILINLANTPAPPDSENPKNLWGHISPGLFAYDLLCSMFNHDESQKAVLDNLSEEVRYNAKALAYPACDPEILETREELSDGRCVLLYTDDLELYDGLGSANGSNATTEAAVSEGDVYIEQHARSGSNMDMDPQPDELNDDEPKTLVPRIPIIQVIRQKINSFCGYFGQEGQIIRRNRRIAKRFFELDEDGEGVGVSEVAQLIGSAFNHTLGQEQEMRGAHRIFELLEKGDEIGELIKLPELLKALPMLEAEMQEQARKRRRTASDSDTAGMWKLTRVLSWGVVTPDTYWLQYWDMLKRLVATYYMIEVPVRFCFISMDNVDLYTDQTLQIVNMSADIFFASNTLLNFFRAYVHPTRGFVTSFQEIRVHYLLNYFFIDVLACCPLDYILNVRLGGNYRGPLARPRAAARLLRLLHMRQILFHDNLSSVTEAEKSRAKLNRGFFRTAWVLVTIMGALVHFAACTWWFVGGRSEDFEPLLSKAEDNPVLYKARGLDSNHSSWIYGYQERPQEADFGMENGAAPFWWQYLISFYWNAGRITGIGTVGEMFPGSVAELTWSCILFLMSMAIGGYVDGILAGKVTMRNDVTIEEKATSRMIEDFLQATDIPDQLAAQIRACAGATVTTQRSYRAEEVSRQLPHPLRQRISSRAFVPLLISSDVFKHCGNGFIVEVGVCCKFIQAAKDSTLVYAGEPCTRLLMLVHGRIIATDETGKDIYRTSTPGTLIGDVPLLFDVRHANGITTGVESKLVCLQREDFLLLCKQFPGERMAMRRTVIKILEGGNDVNAESQSQSQGMSNSKKNGMGRTKSFSPSDNASSFNSSNNSASVVGAMQRSYSRELGEMRKVLQAEQETVKSQQIAYFIECAANGDVERLEESLKGVDVMVDEGDYDQRTALHLAACNGHLVVVQCLVERYGASLISKDRFGHTPMDDAVREHRQDIIHYLSERGALYRVDADIATDMCAAAYENDVDRMKIWLHVVGVDPNIADYDLRTPLHLAASEGHAEVVKLLLAVPGISMSPRDRLGNTPLDDAIRHRQSEVRVLLQQKHAKMGDASVGVTLCTLASENDTDRLRELHLSGLPMSLGDYDARTALHLASSEGKLESVAFLLNEAKVETNPLDRFLCTPLDDAKRHKWSCIEALLIENGGVQGNDPSMKEEVEKFCQWQEGEKARKDEAKLERELHKTSIYGLSKVLHRFSEHPTLDEDVSTFISSAMTFRKMLLGLLERNAMSSEEGEDKEIDQCTKTHMERILGQAAIALDAAASRLGTFITAELLPWIVALSKEDARLLRIFAPGMRETVPRLREQLKESTKITSAMRRLWVETTRDLGCYSCYPLGLLSFRVSQPVTVEAAAPRVDALAGLWLSRAPFIRDDDSYPEDPASPTGRQKSKAATTARSPSATAAPTEAKDSLHNEEEVSQPEEEESLELTQAPMRESKALKMLMGSIEYQITKEAKKLRRASVAV